MTAYAPTDVRSVFVGTGCGESHQVVAQPHGGRGISCPMCEPGALKLWGWAGGPEGVKLTPDEVSVLEDSKQQGLTAQALAAKAIGERLASAVMADAVAPAPSVPTNAGSLSKADLVRLLSEMDPAEKDALLKDVAAPAAKTTAAKKTASKAV